MLGVAPVVLAGLGWFLLRTDAGRAVRAAAENQDRALLLGVPGAPAADHRVGAGRRRWPRSPSSPRPRSRACVPAALVGRHRDPPGPRRRGDRPLPVAPHRAGRRASASASPSGRSAGTCSAESIFDVTFLVVILVVLLARRDAATRAETGETQLGQRRRARSRSRATLRGVPEVRWLRRGLAVVAGARASCSCRSTMSAVDGHDAELRPRVGRSSRCRSWCSPAGAATSASASSASSASARWPPATCSPGWNVDLFVSMVAAMAVGALVAVAIGLPALRIRGLYLAVTTIAFAVALDSYFLNPVELLELRARDSTLRRCCSSASTWRASGCATTSASPSSRSPSLVVRALRRSRPGRVMIATRDNERAAGAMAVPTTRVKLQTFVLSGALAGLAGALYVRRAHAGRRRAGHVPAGVVDRGVLLRRHRRPRVGGRARMSGVFFFRLLDFVLGQDRLSGDVVAIIRLQPVRRRPAVHPVLPARRPLAAGAAPARPVPALGGRSARPARAEPRGRPTDDAEDETHGRRRATT